ncbi:MAG TPA: septation protein SepH [Dermatophilaceae bacterium]|nr:septation protein SepH [Dermatophilaceae bacterium]
MQDLRLVGVHEDGAHLLLTAEDGTRYRVPLDDALRAAARRDRPRLGQLQIEIEGGLRPRDVQALIRSGLNTQEVAERSGWSVDKIQRFEGPVLAERQHVAATARGVRLRHRGAGGAGAPTLADRVGERLATRGVEADSVEWDSWRGEDGRWSVRATFPAGGKQRQATWLFEPATQALQARDDEARWLSEDEPAAATVPVVRDVPVYDVEADGGVEELPSRRRKAAPIDLMSAMRERSGARGRRSGRRRLEPVALPLDGEAPPDEPDAAADAEVAEAPEAIVTAESAQAEAPKTDAGPPEAEAEGPKTEAEDPKTETAEEPVAAATRHTHDDEEPSEPVEPVPAVATTEPAEPKPAPPPAAETPEPERPARRSGRPSVPAWDDIVFGTRSGRD